MIDGTLRSRSTSRLCRTRTQVVGILLLTFCQFFLFGCREREPRTPGRLYIVATTGMIADAARNIVGDSADVIGIMGPGVDPHTYKASQKDVELLIDADIILYNGLHLEGTMGNILEKLAARKPVVAMSAAIDESRIRTLPEMKGAHDPHIWFDVALWSSAVRAVGDSLAAHDPEHSRFYLDNARRYANRLDSLDNWIRHEVETIPRSQRVLITAHDAFGYFGRAYGIEVRGLQGINTVAEPGLGDRTDLVNLIVDRNIKAVFVESSIRPKTVEALAEGVRSKGKSVSIGGQLYSDAMGEEGTPDGTYVGMVESNVRTIVSALR